MGDFGISKMLTTGGKDANTVVGTPYYISPEMVCIFTLREQVKLLSQILTLTAILVFQCDKTVLKLTN